MGEKNTSSELDRIMEWVKNLELKERKNSDDGEIRFFSYSDEGKDEGVLCVINQKDRLKLKEFLKKYKDKVDYCGNYYPILIELPIGKSRSDEISVKEVRDASIQEAEARLNINLEKPFSFLNNSSIWMRLVDCGGDAIAEKEFAYFREIGLYNYPSAQEYLEYNCRLQYHNYLDDKGGDGSGGHGNYITPILYGNEVKAREILKNNFVLRQEPKPNDSPQDFKYLKDFHDIAFRILLIDDKVGVCGDVQYKSLEEVEKDGICAKGCGVCDKCGKCKLHAVKRLMDDGKKKNDKDEYVDSGDGKGEVFTGIGETIDYFYWQESGIECYYCPTIIKDFIEDNDKLGDYDGIRLFQKDSGEKEKIEKEETNGKKKYIKIECDFAPVIDRKDPKVQIVGVRDVRTALLLLSKFKFDMVFSDYLLDKKDKSPEERDYANQLFEFLSYEYGGDIKNEQDETLKQRLMALEQFRHDVIDNRGPLNKLWVLPITGFNQTFIQDLYRNQINLIDYKWNISNGADPITTPWQFLYHLNMFVELQLRHCVFKMEQLLTFLLYTCEDLKTLNDKRDETTFDDFQSLMGSEYATLMQLYGNKLPIKRDAVTEATQEKDTFDKSVFATYIWKHFYSNNKYVNELELCRLMQRFYHQASTMYNDRNGCQRLNEAFENLCFLIRTNKAVKKENNLCDKLDSDAGLPLLKKMIETCTFNSKQVDENNVKSKVRENV